MIYIEMIYYIVGILSALLTAGSVFVALRTYLFNRSMLRTQQSIELMKFYKDSVLWFGYAIEYVNEKSGMNVELSKISISENSTFTEVELNRNKIDKKNIDNIYKSKEFAKAVWEANSMYKLTLPVKVVIKNVDEKSKQVNVTYDMRSACETFMQKVVYETLNNLEYFSANFTHGTADSDTAYDSLHQTFIPLVETLYYQIAQNNKERADDYYKNTISLYKKWKKQQKKDYEKADTNYNEDIIKRDTIIK